MIRMDGKGFLPLRSAGAHVGMLLCRACTLFAISVAVAQSPAQTILAPGDLAIIQYRTDSKDGFSFVSFVDIEPDTTVLFTDKGWFGSGLCRSENIWPWTAPANGLPKGSVVNITIGRGLGSEHGDQIIAFQGTPAYPRFIYGISTSPWLSTGAIEPSTSYLPAGLINGDTARDFPEHHDNGYFNVARVAGTPTKIRAEIGRLTKWHRSNKPSLPFRRPSEWSFSVADPINDTLFIQADTRDTPFIRLAPRGHGFLSASTGDPTDPGHVRGVDFLIRGNNPDQAMVQAAHAPEPGKPYAPPELKLTGAGARRTLTITPTGQGYARITVCVTNGSASDRYTLLYASSTQHAVPLNTRHHHTHSSDASAAVPAGPDHMLVADDEDEVIRLYHRYQSGAPLAAFDLVPFLNLTDKKYGFPREVDLEGATEVGPRVYWIGSHGNSKSGRFRPNRSRIISTKRAGTGSGTTLSYIGHYEGLRDDLLNWDKDNGHGMGENYFGFSGSAHAAMKGGIEPKRPDGFNIEALAMMPGSSTDAYIGFRAPLVPPGNRRYALIIPVTHLTTIADTSAPSGSAHFGTPILLDLGGRGIRCMERNASNDYIIVAGPPGESENPAVDFQVYTWNGCPDTPPHPCRSDAATAGLEGAIEGIVEVCPDNTGTFHALLDQGATEWYGDGRKAKEHVGPLRKFISGRLSYTPVTPY